MTLRNQLLDIMLACLLIVPASNAQDSYIVTQQRVVSMMPVYQNWLDTNDNSLYETSVPLYIYYPINRAMSASLQTHQATVAGDNVETLSGITDIQLGFNYHLEQYNLVLNLGMNIPSGKRELTPAEFITSSRVSFNHLNFRVPNFGQGLNIAPGATWAYSVSEKLVVGTGLSFQIKGGFKPVAGMPDEYKPGSEMLFTGGIDYRLGETAAISGDIIYILYGPDKMAGNEVFDSGDMFISNLQFRKYFGFDELHFFTRFRTKGKNRQVFAGALVEEAVRSTPNQIEARLTYRKRFKSNISLGFMLEIRDFENTNRLTGIEMRGLGLLPEFAVSRNLFIPGRIKYMQGSYDGADTNFTGYEFGIGLRYVF